MTVTPNIGVLVRIVRLRVNISAALIYIVLVQPGLLAQRLEVASSPTELVSVRFDPVVGLTTEQMRLRLAESGELTLTLTIVYRGTTRPQPVNAIEVVLARDFADVSVMPTQQAIEQNTHFTVDGEQFEHRGTLNPRAGDRPSTAAVAMVFRNDAAARLANAALISGRALDADFDLTPEEVNAVTTVVREWTVRGR